MPDTGPMNGYAAITSLVVLIVACLWLGALARRAIARSAFLSGYFLGNRGLGPWALALTATVQSGGTFVGYPSFVYSYGWIVLLWISGYMVVPLTNFGLTGKRVAQLSRRTGAITVPDLFRARFDSSHVGLAASLLLLVFLMFTTVAQFKAGGVVMKTALLGATPVSGEVAKQEVAKQEVADQKVADQKVADKKAADQKVADKKAADKIDRDYLIGLGVFTLTVVLYTMVGGFLASVWTDLFQSVLMAIGVVILVVLALQQAGGMEEATRASMERLGAGYVTGPGYRPTPDVPPFLPVSMSFGMFLLWVMAGVGQPAGVVRLMASKDTATFRRSIVLLSLYNMLIYVPLAIICICARKILPDLPPGHHDEVVPRMALHCAASAPGGTLLAGLILAAPFGAVMASVSTFLVVIASGLVHDVYQRLINPEARVKTLRVLTYVVTLLVGAGALAANLQPVRHLQVLIVISGSGVGSTFLVPVLMACYWRRATAAGALAAMLGGAGTVLLLLLAGWFNKAPTAELKPLQLLGMDPLVWGVLVSAIAGVLVSLMTRPPERDLVTRLFDAPQPA